MILTHPAKAERAYKQYVNRYIRNGGKVNRKVLLQIAISTLLRVDKQASVLGVPVSTGVADVALEWVDEQADYVKALRREYKAASTQGRRNKVLFAARNQLGNLQAGLASKRMEDIGIGKFSWITKRDERVRDEHARKHRKTYSIKKGAPSGDAFPGDGWACRCRMQPIVSKKARKNIELSKTFIGRNRFKAYALAFGIAIGAGIVSLADV